MFHSVTGTLQSTYVRDTCRRPAVGSLETFSTPFRGKLAKAERFILVVYFNCFLDLYVLYAGNERLDNVVDNSVLSLNGP